MNEYYSLHDIDATGANYRVIIGERSNGKTYACKRRGVEKFFDRGEQFAYIRRTVEEIKQKRINTLFADMAEVIREYAARHEGEYGHHDRFEVQARNGQFLLIGITDGHDDDTGKWVPIFRQPLAVIGYYFALNQGIYDKGSSFPKVTTIIYDEFLTSGYELPDEFTLLLNLISTIKRKRSDCVIYLLGNTVSRNSANLEAMNINVRDLKQGEIKSYVYYGDGNVMNTVAVEYCRHYAQDTDSEAFFTFGTQEELMITRGEWETGGYPLFDGPITETVNAGLILSTGHIRLYAYMSDSTLYVSSKREIKRIEYITVGKEPTRLNRKQIRIDSPAADSIKRVLSFYWTNGFCKFDANVTGGDFRKFLENC